MALPATGAPFTGPPVVLCGFTPPDDYWEVLQRGNGLVTDRSAFRLFSVGVGGVGPSVEQWNEAPWMRGYRRLIPGFLSVAEDVFGDQYGYRFGQRVELSKLYCEGAEIERIESSSLLEFLDTQVLVDAPTAFDADLAARAWEAGLRPSADAHLAFELPLIAGGEYAVDNLTVESIPLHLGVLVQLSARIRGPLEGSSSAETGEDSGQNGSRRT